MLSSSYLLVVAFALSTQLMLAFAAPSAVSRGLPNQTNGGGIIAEFRNPDGLRRAIFDSRSITSGYSAGDGIPEDLYSENPGSSHADDVRADQPRNLASGASESE